MNKLASEQLLHQEASAAAKRRRTISYRMKTTQIDKYQIYKNKTSIILKKMRLLSNLVSSRRNSLAGPLTIAAIYCIVLAFAAPLSSSIYTEYVYNYEASIASGSNGFRIKAKAHLELVYADGAAGDSGGQLMRLRLTDPVFYAGPQAGGEPLVNKGNKQLKPDHDLYAHVVTLANGTAYIKALYTHQADATTFKNIKKSILLNLLPTNHHLSQPLSNKLDSVDSGKVAIDDNNSQQPELFSPDSISQVKIFSKPLQGRQTTTSSSSLTDTNTDSNELNSDSTGLRPQVFELVEGHQNITFGSRVFAEAQSNLSTSFHLSLVDQLESSVHKQLDSARSLAGALKILLAKDAAYQADTVQLERERRVKSTHHSGLSLMKLFELYELSLTDESLASVEAAVAYLRILDRLRDSKGTNLREIMSVLEKSQPDVQSSFLDILAAARTKDSIMAALKHIKLARSRDLDTAERFLTAISVAAKTTAKMHLRRYIQSPYYFEPTPAPKRSKQARDQLAPMASLEFIANELLASLKKTPANKWASHKLRWSTLLTLATLVNANNQEHKFGQQQAQSSAEQLDLEVSNLLLAELDNCAKKDTDCRIVALQAIGNVGLLKDEHFQALKGHVLGQSGRRESITAIRVLRDLLQHQAKDKPFTQAFYTSLKELLLRITYDDKQETTSRVLAAEMIVRFVPNSLASEELLRHLPSFGNNELATMIYSRMQSLRPDSLAKHNDNWYWKSCIINGTSTSFVKTMARTDSLNASYGVNVELLNKGKLLKESSFDVFLDTKQRTQDLFSLGIFARGLNNLPGVSSDDGDDGNEDNKDTIAGMTLRILGGYLRPYIFFNSSGQLISEVMMGTASNPTTAFNGDLLLIDHQEAYPLISGFIAEQEMRGVLSIDVAGKISVSLWRRESNSVVTTKAAVIVQASQSVFTSFDKLWQSHLFSFGGQALIDFVADSSFASSPFQICLQVTQPAFMIRHNSRSHDQTMSDQVRRKITRRNFSIGAKSYSLNTENNKMCSAIFRDDL